MISDGDLREAARALLAGLIDYAGLFPPESLPLEQAAANYGRYRQEPEGWLLARFIIPAARLADLTAIAAGRFAAGDPWPFAVLGRSGAAAADFLANLAADLDDVAAFRDAHGAAVDASTYEVKLPPALFAAPDPTALAELLSAAGAQLAAAGLRPFFEPPLGPAWQANIDLTAAALAAHNRETGGDAGFKFRAGGTEPAAVPSVEQVAHAIAACRDAGVPLKFTAGLHHPFRHFDTELGATRHGFANAFVAGILAHAGGLAPAEIAAIVADEDAGHFQFAAGGLRWRDRRATAAEIAAARRTAVLSYGSCSFVEPRDDLRALGWIGPGG